MTFRVYGAWGETMAADTAPPLAVRGQRAPYLNSAANEPVVTVLTCGEADALSATAEN